MTAPVRVRVAVRLAETDAQGVVYYGSYLTYFEVARVALLRQAGLPLQGPGGQLFVARVTCTYRAPARFGDELELAAWVARVGRSSLGLGHAITRVADGVRVAEGEDLLVFTGPDGRPATLPADARRALLDLHRPPTEDGYAPLAGVARVALGSAHPAKLRAAREVFDRLAPAAELAAVAVDPGVGPLPRGEEAILAGAERRAREAMERAGADLGVGMEDGAVATPAGTLLGGWCVVLDRRGRRGAARTAGFPLPGDDPAAALAALAAGDGRGAVHRLTRGLVDRAQRWEQALLLALVPWLRPEVAPAGAPAAGRDPALREEGAP